MRAALPTVFPLSKWGSLLDTSGQLVLPAAQGPLFGPLRLFGPRQASQCFLKLSEPDMYCLSPFTASLPLGPQRELERDVSTFHSPHLCLRSDRIETAWPALAWDLGMVKSQESARLARPSKG